MADNKMALIPSPSSFILINKMCCDFLVVLHPVCLRRLERDSIFLHPLSTPGLVCLPLGTSDLHVN